MTSAIGLTSTLAPTRIPSTIKLNSIFLIGLHTPKYIAKVRVKENKSSGAKLRLEIKSEGSKLTKRIAISAIFLEDNFKVILYIRINISTNIMIYTKSEIKNERMMIKKSIEF